MNVLRSIAAIVLFAGLLALPAAAQSGSRGQLSENAALRYWSAFAEMRDSAMATHPMPALDDPAVKELFDKNKAALEEMYRGTLLPNCDWGIDYELGANAPVEYVRKAIVLGKLNALYVMHLDAHGDTDAAAILLMAHLPLIPNIAHAGISPAQRSALQNAVMQLGPTGLDWQGAVKRELGLYQGADHGLSTQGLAALAQISPLYVRAMSDPSVLPQLQSMIAGAPSDLRRFMPNPQRVVDAEESLENHLAEARGPLQ